MRRILLYFALLSASFLLLDRAVALVLSKALFPSVLSGEAGGDINYLLEKKRDADLLVLGSSRARHHLDPALLTSNVARRPFNAGANGVGDLTYASVVLDLALREGLRPRAVIPQADAWEFARGADTGAQARMRRARSLSALYPFLGRSPVLERAVREQAGFRERTLLLLLRSYRFNGKVLNLLAHRLRPAGTRDGYEALEGRLARAAVPAVPRERPGIGPGSPPVSAANRALKEIAEACARQDIRLVVLIAPYLEERASAESRRLLRATLAKAGANRVVDFGHLPAPLENPALWRDPAHLNGEGAALLSKMLADSLRVPEP
jgi:hypothetical protein